MSQKDNNNCQPNCPCGNHKRRTKCKIFACGELAEYVAGSHSGVCAKHADTKVIQCFDCGAKQSREGAYIWSKMRWSATTSGNKIKGHKHKWKVIWTNLGQVKASSPPRGGNINK